MSKAGESESVGHPLPSATEGLRRTMMDTDIPYGEFLLGESTCPRVPPESPTQTIDGEGGANKETKTLGVVFDIDGTLIADHERDCLCGIQIRPGAVDFLVWLKRQGHALSVWTKASGFWAHAVVKKVCPLVSGPHECAGVRCRETFDFVWCSEKCTVLRKPTLYWQTRYAAGEADIDHCKWCEAYGGSCRRCECHNWDVGECPCRSIKDLRKVFGRSVRRAEDETVRFARERTVIVEDTPQNCRYNYGNAIYVPTYRGGLDGNDVFPKMQTFFENVLLDCEDVRFLQKCGHGRRYHACYRQSWLYP